MWIAVTSQYEKSRAYNNHDDKFYRALLVDAPQHVRANQVVGKVPTRMTKRKFKRAGDAMGWAIEFNKRYPRLLVANQVYEIKERERQLAARPWFRKMWDSLWLFWHKISASMFRNTNTL